MATHPARAAPLSTVYTPFTDKYKNGDLIQIDFERDGDWDHTMVVYGVSSNELYLASHSSLYPLDTLSQVKARNPNANYIGWSIK